VLATAMTVGLAVDFAGLDAVKMLFWSAVVNGLLAPPLILLILLLTSDRRVMGDRINSPIEQIVGWMTFAIMAAAAAGLMLA
jgi:Mn2+/Fe2+ NRAMP family transporter